MNLNRLKLIGLMAGALISLSVSQTATVFGSATPVITVSEVFNISISGRNYRVLISTNALDQVQVNDAGTAFTLTLTQMLGGEVQISSPDRMDIGGTNNSLRESLAFCNENESRLKIASSATTNVVITITPPSAGTVCTSTGSGGGGGGGGGGSSSPPPPAPEPLPAEQPPAEQPGEQPAAPPEEEEEELKFKDVPKTDKFIVPLVQLMLERKTYKFPKTAIFGTKKVTKGTFALQIALAVSDLDFGFEKYPGLAKIRKTAVKTWPDVAKNFPKGKVKRYDFYELLLVARGIGKIESKTTKDLKKACKDVEKPTRDMAKVYFAAKKFGFAGVYQGGKCRLEMPFARKEAAKFAMKAYAIQPAVEAPEESTPQPEPSAPPSETTTP